MASLSLSRRLTTLKTVLAAVPSAAPIASPFHSSAAHTMSWHANYPATKSTPPEITPAELAAITGEVGVDYIVVDARRTDIADDEGSPRTIHPAAINLPAQSFYPTLPASGQLLRRIPKVIFHCNSCKPGGRGPRSAAWYQDWLDAQGETGSKAYVLQGGWKAWMEQYPDKVVKV